MNQVGEPYGALVFAKAESSHLAREAVVGELTQRSMGGYWGFTLPFLEPVQVGTDDGKAVVEKYWNAYIEQGVQDVDDSPDGDR